MATSYLSKAKNVALVVKCVFEWLSLIAITIASLAIAFEAIAQIKQNQIYLSSCIFILMYLVSLFFAEVFACIIFIFLIPLVPNLSGILMQFNVASVVSLPIAGLDLVAGYFLGTLSKHLIGYCALRNFTSLRIMMSPWPINFLIVVITLSAILTISRNFWASSSPLALNSISMNLINSRGIGWFEDWRPLIDWMAYMMAGATALLLCRRLKFSKNRLAEVFRPLMAGLFASGILFIIQNSPLFKGIIRFTSFGFQPDLHAYAGYTLLGVIGFWGYFFIAKLKIERLLIILAIALSWYGLIISISKASIFFAIFFSAIGFLCWASKYYKEGNQKLSVLMLAIFVLSSLLVLASSNEIGVAPSWLNHHYQIFKRLNWSEFNQINEALSYRPGIWLTALQMWSQYPMFGIGLGNFYQLSHLFNFSNVPDLMVGENAHNYFLQTLAETGLIGCATFAIAILAPFLLIKDRRVLMPAAVALLSLFLGNIYAHSFLVRENLFLAAIFLGLMYSYVPQEKLAFSPYKLLVSWKPRFPWKLVVPFSCFVIIGLGAREVYKSFYTFPFQYGTLCFVNKPLTPDGWSSGLYEIPLPAGSHGAELSIKIARPNLQESPLGAKFEILDSGNQVLASRAYEWRENGPQKLVINIPTDATIQESGAKAALKLSSCYTPRNLGESIDGRRLGVIVDSSIIR